jgi:hypothetical protein
MSLMPDNPEQSKIIAKCVERAIDDAIRDMRKALEYKTAKIEELYTKQGDLIDMTFLTDSVVIGAIAAVKAYDYSLINEEFARVWLKDFYGRIFKSLKDYMPNTIFRITIREKKNYEK